MTPPFSSIARSTPEARKFVCAVSFRLSIFRLALSLTLPETEKNNRLDGAELENGIEGRQQVSRGEVEEVESVERQRDGNVVDYCGESSEISADIGRMRD